MAEPTAPVPDSDPLPVRDRGMRSLNFKISNMGRSILQRLKRVSQKPKECPQTCRPLAELKVLIDTCKTIDVTGQSALSRHLDARSIQN